MFSAANDFAVIMHALPNVKLVGDRTGEPLVIVEYKRPSVNITQKTFDPIVRYNMVLHARYLIVSNGMEHYCCQIDYETGNYRFLEDIPCYSDL